MTVAFAPLSVIAADKEKSGEPPPPTAADFAKLQREVAEQRSLIIQMMQVEQQRYDMLLRLLQSGGQLPSTSALPPPVPPPGAPPASASASTSGGTSGPAGKIGGSGERVGTVSGRVEVRGGDLKEAYVYVDVSKGSSARGHTLEIKQKDKQFWPATAVVQRGTSVTFPNMDAVFHNVFSTSGRNSFDLGSYRSGDPARSVVLTTPGVVEVFCNIHSKMNANILVVPGPLFAKVGADGSYRIENVPTGARRIVAWSPNAKAVQQKIEVGSSGGQANFTLEIESAKAHLNKLGQPYGSYKEYGIVVTADGGLHRLSMTSAGKKASLLCAVAAVAAAAGAIAARQMQSSAAAAAALKTQTEANGVMDAAQKSLEGLERGLEIDVKAAAGIPQLKAALADGVDAATILDLFESEDWWAPFRSRGAALVTTGRTLAARMGKGDKRMPLPDTGMLEHAQTAGAASGVLVGDSALIVAVVPVGNARRGDSTYLVLAMPVEAQDLQKATGAPVMISDGHRPVSVAGSASQQSALSRLVGKEGEGRAHDPESTWFALAAPVSPKLWLWVLHPAETAAASPVVPALLGVLAILLGGAAFLLGRRGAPADHAAAAAAVGGSGLPVDEVPELAPRTVRERRGTKPYEMGGELGHRPTEVAKSGSEPASSALPAWNAGIAGQAAASAAVDPYPSSTRVGTDSSTFGRYRLLQRLGEGGMAELYTAVLHGAEGFRRVYVVKRLRPEVARNRAAVEQFIDEAKLGSTLVHSNIVPVFDFGKVADEYFLAQEYIIGRDLGKVVKKHLETAGRPLSEKFVLYVVHEVLEALAYAHNRTDAAGKPIGLVHRDISPGNVMVTARGEVKLFDFGIVKGEGRVSRTDVGVVKGNVSFMSPEQARGATVDARSDLFSLGLVLYYGLTGEQLYPGQSTFDQLMRAATGPKTEQLKLLAELPPVAAMLVTRVLAVDPAMRYQTAAEFAAAVAPHVSGGKAEAGALMLQLFGEEFRRESAA